jgi:hypothetical protein
MTMRVRFAVALIALLSATALAVCQPGDEPWSDEIWTGTVAGRAVTCCARHHLTPLGRYTNFDDVALWCPHTPRPSLHVFADTDPATGVPVGNLVGSARACRHGPRFRHPRRLTGKPHFGIHQSGCCPFAVTHLDGPVGMYDSATGAFVAANGKTVTGVRGTVSCRRRIFNVDLAFQR